MNIKTDRNIGCMFSISNSEFIISEFFPFNTEQRRRDRINEKMKALQELIPNSNKVDKASMLDEAIEYLKTLQFQLQVTNKYYL